MLARVEFGIIGRTRGAGRAGSAVAAAAYNLCTQLDGFDFRRKGAEHVSGAVLLPPGAPPELSDPGTLWHAAEGCERRADAQLARQMLVTVPREIDAADRLDFVRAIVAPYVADGMGCQIDVHCPRAADGDEQPHAHVLLTLRRVTDAGLSTTKAREWNDAFRAEGGRAERARIGARATAWLHAHGIQQDYDLRSLATRGDDRPPEPAAPRADWQRWLREGSDPARAPIRVADILAHRHQLAAMTAAGRRRDAASEEVAILTAQLAAAESRHAHAIASPPGARTAPFRTSGISRDPSKTPAKEESIMPKPTSNAAHRPPSRRPPRQDEAWMRHGGGLDALSPPLRKQAEASYRRWAKGSPDAARKHRLESYVAYVQDAAAERAAKAAAATPPVAEAAAPGVAAEAQRDQEIARRSHLMRLLADRYETPDALASHVQGVQLDAEARTATLALTGGGHVVDHGDRLTCDTMTPAAAEAMAAAAAARGWSKVTITGTDADRDVIAAACALRVPPLACAHPLSKTAQESVTRHLRERAIASVASPPIDADADPQARAAAQVDRAEAMARAALAGRPEGSTDPEAIAAPRLADLSERHGVAREDAAEAVAAAAGHRAEHPWAVRIFDATARRRQAALDADARRLTVAAESLDRTRGTEGKRIVREAGAQARAIAHAVDDWRWSPAVRKASAQLDQFTAIRRAVQAGDTATIAAAAQGDMKAAIVAAQATASPPARAERPRTPPATARDAAVLALHAAEAGCEPGADLTRARAATAAAVAGDELTVRAAATGNAAGALAAGQAWQRRQEDDRRRQAAIAAATTMPEGPGMAPA